MFFDEKLTGEQFITLNYLCHQSLSKTHRIDSLSWLTNEKIYHMILVIIIVVRGETMLQRALGSGWGVMIPGALIVALGYAGVSADVWRVLVAVGMLMSAAMIWHRQLRHFILLPSCVALIGGIMLMIVDIKLRG